MLGWGDDQIAATLGIVTPSLAHVFGILWRWGIPLALGAVTLLVYHSWWNRQHRAASLATQKDTASIAKPNEVDQPSYLPYRDTELGLAVYLMVKRSAWGRSFSAQQPKPTYIDEERYLMETASLLITEEAINGNLVIRGRPPNGADYETIPREWWRLAHLDVEPNVIRIWRVFPAPRTEVSPERISKLLSYDSLIVDSHQFEGRWPKATDDLGKP